jgi:mRNA-degrading endonuclease toxin of MazEF toxin-antitoxin module
MADQIMTASKGRLSSRIGALAPSDLRAVEGAILLHLGIHR